MLLGKVVGHVWGSKTDSGIESTKLLIVEPVHKSYPSIACNHIVAADRISAGIGDTVVVTFGQGARESEDTLGNAPCETAVACIVDSIDADTD